jgi:acyl-CoA thioesterase-1
MIVKFLKLLFICLSFFVATLSAKEAVILALGDSLTEGLGVETNQAWPSLLNTTLHQSGYAYQVVNGGLSGSTSASGPSRLKWYLRLKPEVVIVALGANDGLRGLPVSEMRSNLSVTIEAAKKSGATVLLCGMKVPPNYGPEYSKAFEDVFMSLARTYQVSFLPFLLEHVAGDESLNQADHIHPNEKGHKLVMKNVFDALVPLLKK